MSRKGQIWISAVLYLLVTAIVMFLVLDAGVPLLSNMKDKSLFTRTKDNFVNLDQHIKKMSFSEEGSQEVIPFEIKDGTFRVDDTNLVWNMETDANIIEPNSKIDLGDLYLVSNLDVTAKDKGSYYVLENSMISVELNKFGSANSYVPIDLYDLIESVTYLATGKKASGTYQIDVSGFNHSVGLTGYTEIVNEGSSLVEGTYIAHINSSVAKYDVYITLPSLSDFVTIDVKPN